MKSGEKNVGEFFELSGSVARQENVENEQRCNEARTQRRKILKRADGCTADRSHKPHINNIISHMAGAFILRINISYSGALGTVRIQNIT